MENKTDLEEGEVEDKFKLHPNIYIRIGETKYGASALLSVRDMEYIVGIDVNQNSIDYKVLSEEIIYATRQNWKSCLIFFLWLL